MVKLNLILHDGGLKSYWQGSLKTMEVLNSPHAGNNGLVASFV